MDLSRANAVPSRISGLLGLARRAGGVAAGTDAVRDAIREGSARLVLVASDAAPGQTAKVRRTLAGHSVPHGVWGTRAELGATVGVKTLTAVAVTQPKLAAEILDVLGSARVQGAEA
jgi:ribosomal protein L7Ae-like RNA K-turn-binding protein